MNVQFVGPNEHSPARYCMICNRPFDYVLRQERGLDDKGKIFVRYWHEMQGVVNLADDIHVRVKGRDRHMRCGLCGYCADDVLSGKFSRRLVLSMAEQAWIVYFMGLPAYEGVNP